MARKEESRSLMSHRSNPFAKSDNQNQIAEENEQAEVDAEFAQFSQSIQQRETNNPEEN